MASSSSSSASRSWKYDVFISFRGEDTRKTFVDHLYSALQQHHILTYMDNVTLDRGDTIGPALLNAIYESYIALIIFSKNYANSSWCLDELSYIMKCKKDSGQIVLPIFYHVDPSDVRKQKRKYGEAFAEHELSENNKKKVESWKKALVDASNIVGWEPKHVANGHEARCIKEIVGSILDKLSFSDSTVEDENLVGMGTRLQQLRSHLRIGAGGVRMVGIWGVGGGGKTTLAFSAYMKLREHFHGHYFIANIREKSQQINGLEKLQEMVLSEVSKERAAVTSVQEGRSKIQRMLCRRNVFIVLDDIDHLDQLKALAGYHKWFGDGSRILITTRDHHLLTIHRVDVISHINLLSHDEATRLFNKHAYCEYKPVPDYEMLSQQIVTYAAGLPLALIVLGSFLYDKDKDEWLSALDRLKYHPEMGIVEKLKISYDGLKDVEKELFLDIACFYRWKSKDKAMEILDACGFYPAIGVKVLIQKALVMVSKDGRFNMHDLVQEMAHYIVRGEHPYNPENHSRVWKQEDIEDMCSNNATMENDKIEALEYVDAMEDDNAVCSLHFIMLVSNMKKLRFLKVRKSSFDEGPSFLSNELRYIDWKDYPASPFPESFQPRKLVVLKIVGSLQKELWKGYKYLPCLKELELSWMEALVRTPDFGGLPCLQKLILAGCDCLEKIHESLGNHNSLVYVHVEDCKKLTRFPSIVRMEKLEILEISFCQALVEFPKIEAKMDSLIKLSLRLVVIEILPSTIVEYCTNLTSLSLEHCDNLKSIDGNFHALKGLQEFRLCGCKRFEKLPKGVFNKNLDGFGLRKLDLSYCNLGDGEIPKEVGELSRLQELYLSSNDFTRLDFSLPRLTSLKLLDLYSCENLVELPELPSSLAILVASKCKSLEAIKDDAHRRCKWLCKVSLFSFRRNIMTGGERLLDTMLQGMAVKSGWCMILRLRDVSAIASGFEPRLIRGGRCRMQLLENWSKHFSGFLFYTASDSYIRAPSISMKHVEKSVGDTQDVYWDEEENVGETWVGYVPFSLLRETSWWDPTSTAVEVEFNNSEIINSKIRKCGMKLVPKGGAASDAECSGSSETTPTTHSSSSDYDDYKCELRILHDSKSAFEFKIHGRW